MSLAHIALPAALATHTLPGEPHVYTPIGVALAWEQLGVLGGQWSSVRASAARLMCASVRSIVVSGGMQLLGKLSLACI